MSEENAVEETENQPPVEAAFSSPEVARDYEKEAREMGWVPEAEFKGPKEKWKPADKFVDDGEKILPIVRANERKLREELLKERADFAKRIERSERVTKAAFEAMERQHKAELDRVRKEQREAVASGDVAEWDRLEKVKDGLEKSAPKAVEAEKTDPAAAHEAEKAKWIADNPWFNEDFEMQDFAIRYSDFHGQRNPNLTFAENMKNVEAEVRKKFPQKFGKTAANGHAAVDAGGDFSGGFKGKGKTGADLPAEARMAGERYVKQGLFKDLNAYAKEYFNG